MCYPSFLKHRHVVISGILFHDEFIEVTDEFNFRRAFLAVHGPDQVPWIIPKEDRTIHVSEL